MISFTRWFWTRYFPWWCVVEVSFGAICYFVTLWMTPKVAQHTDNLVISKQLVCNCTRCICQCDVNDCHKVAANTEEGRKSLGLALSWNDLQLEKHNREYESRNTWVRKEIKFIGNIHMAWDENGWG